MPVAVSSNFKTRPSAYHVFRSFAPPGPRSFLSIPSILALVCAWVVLPAFVGSTHPACYGSDFHQRTDSCLKPVKHHVQRRHGL